MGNIFTALSNATFCMCSILSPELDSHLRSLGRIPGALYWADVCVWGAPLSRTVVILISFSCKKLGRFINYKDMFVFDKWNVLFEFVCLNFFTRWSENAKDSGWALQSRCATIVRADCSWSSPFACLRGLLTATEFNITIWQLSKRRPTTSNGLFTIQYSYCIFSFCKVDEKVFEKSEVPEKDFWKIFLLFHVSLRKTKCESVLKI